MDALPKLAVVGGVKWPEGGVKLKDGNHLTTTYFGRMPEPYKATLEELLTAEALSP